MILQPFISAKSLEREEFSGVQIIPPGILMLRGIHNNYDSRGHSLVAEVVVAVVLVVLSLVVLVGGGGRGVEICTQPFLVSHVISNT